MNKVKVSKTPPHLDQDARQSTVNGATKMEESSQLNPSTKYTPFPTDSLPPFAADFVKNAALSIGCDDSYIALPLLAVFAAAIGNSRKLYVKRTWSASSAIWTAIVGESGTAKSPAMSLVMKPIEALQATALKRHAEEMTEFEKAKHEFDKELALYKRGKSEGDAPPLSPEVPQPHRLVVQDTTVEALAPIFLHNPRGLLLSRDELSGWLGSFNRYSGKQGADEAAWLSMFDGASLIVDRKGGNGPIYVPSALISITGGIQPKILSTALTSEHRASGLAARILVASPPRIAQKWTDAELHPGYILEMASLIGKLNGLQLEFDEEGNANPRVIHMSAEAKSAWVAYYNRHHETQAAMIGDDASAWAKLLGYVPRLALILHYVRWASDEKLENENEVDIESMSIAIALVDWFKGEVDRIYAILSESEETAELRQLVDWIDRKCDGQASAREVTQGIRRIENTDHAESELNRAAKVGLGEWCILAPSESGGRPKRVFRTPNASTVYGTCQNPGSN